MTRKMNHQTKKSLAPKTAFGNHVSFSQRKTRRQFKSNLQWVTVVVDQKPLKLLLSARQIRSLGKEQPPKALLKQLKLLAK